MYWLDWRYHVLSDSEDDSEDASGLGVNLKEAQMQVKRFSSKHYTSHKRVPERVAAALDA